MIEKEEREKENERMIESGTHDLRMRNERVITS
jgi:hypothetical protein